VSRHGAGLQDLDKRLADGGDFASVPSFVVAGGMMAAIVAAFALLANDFALAAGRAFLARRAWSESHYSPPSVKPAG
jgi:hypothetical protein